jgi:site-specific DNA recombinase
MGRLVSKMKKESTPLRVGLYIRVSTQEQASNPEGSIKSQEQRLRQHLAMKNQDSYLGEVAHVFIDRALSGKDTNRPELQRLLSMIRAGEIHLVMASELSRLSRSMKDFASIWELMQEHDCGFLSLRENFDTTTAAGEMVLYTVANIAQFERKQCSERISANFLARAERGLFNGGSVPFGYAVDPEKRGHLMIVPDEAAIVQEIFRTFGEQGCLSKTGQSLNDRGVRLTRQRRSGGNRPRLGHFTDGNLYQLLTNKVYVAIRVFHDKEGEEKVGPACWDPIVEKDVFEKVQMTLKSNRYSYRSQSSKRYPYIFSRLVACGQCGDRLTGKSAHGNGGKIGYYEHGWAVKRQAYLNKKVFDCQPHRVLAKILEPLVWDDIFRVLTHPTDAQKIIALAKKHHDSQGHVTQADKVKLQIRDIELQTDALAEHLAKIPKSVSPAPIFAQMERMEGVKADLQRELDRVQQEGHLLDPPASLATYESYLAQLREMLDGSGEVATALKTRLVQKMIHQVMVFPNEVKIQYKVGAAHLRHGLIELQKSGAAPNKKAESQAFFPVIPLKKNSNDFGSNRLTNGWSDWG